MPPFSGDILPPSVSWVRSASWSCRCPFWGVLLLAAGLATAGLATAGLATAGPSVPSQLLRQEVEAAESLQAHRSMLLAAPAVFARQYVEFGYARNFPVAYANSRFLPGLAHPLLTYRYFLTDTWMLGFAGQFKFFGERGYNEDLVFFTLSQEGFYVLRLYHPFYGLLGSKWHYLYPSRKGMLPLQRHPRAESELGVALATGLLWRLSSRHLLEVKVDRWRGTKSMRYHGLELSLSLGLAL